MPFYDTFISSNKKPRDKWKDGLQALVEREFENAPTYYEDVEEEDDFGTLTFHPINVRVNTIIDAKTGQRINDDYRKLIFEDLDYKPPIGIRYRFDDNIWITYSTDNIKTDTAAIYVRRCNNTMNMQDEYGNIHREPCYIDYRVNENQIFRNYSIDVASGRIWIQVQLNDYTKDIDVNDRFIFGEDAYKIRERSRFDRRYTYDEGSVRYISFYADYDNLADDDNIKLGVANYKKYDWQIKSESNISNLVGYTDKIIYKVYLNDENINEDVIWETSDENIAQVTPDGEFVLKSIGSCYFIGKMKNNLSISCIIDVNVVEELTDLYTTILEPTVNYIRLDEVQQYSVYEYNNSAIMDTKFKIECFDMPDKYYDFKSDGNNFWIYNRKTCDDILLKIVYTNLRTSESNAFYVELGGIV